MSKLKKFHKWASKDSSPKTTRFMTKYLMPLGIIFMAYMALDLHFMADSDLGEFSKHKIKIGKVILSKRSNHKINETIYTDLLIYPQNTGIIFTYLSLNQDQISQIENSLRNGLEVDILSEKKLLGFHQSPKYKIAHLTVGEDEIISLHKEQRNWRKVSILCAASTILFLVWYLSRMYRYKKYGRI